jgi:hypothetical protein
LDKTTRKEHVPARKRARTSANEAWGSAAQPEPLPGSRATTPPGMDNYIVILKDDVVPQTSRSRRREVYESNVGRVAVFQNKLRHWLSEHGLDSEVAGIAEPMGFPLVTLTATPAVAKAIESIPEVESVVRDSDAIRLAHE